MWRLVVVLAMLRALPTLARRADAPDPGREQPAIAGGPSAVAQVANLAALRALPPSLHPMVDRAGFARPGDGGGARYTWSALACPANSGRGDDGSQVAPLHGVGCWIADFAGVQPTPLIWGAAGDGTADDAGAMQAALSAMAGQALWTGPHLYALASQVTVPPSTKVICAGWRQTTSHGMGGFRARDADLSLMALSSGDALSDCYFDMASAGASTAGAAVTTGAAVSNTLITDAWVQGGCIAFDINGNTITLDTVYAHSFSGPGCGGIRIGHATTGAVTTDVRVTGSTMSAGTAPVAEFDMKIEDCGGCLIQSSDMLFARYGTWLLPGANQQIVWLTETGTYVGDTNQISGLRVDTAAASAVIKGLQFTATWTSNARGPGVDIENTAAGILAGVHFSAHRAYTNGGGGFAVGAGRDVTIDGSHVCGSGDDSAGIRVQPGVSNGAIRSTQSSGECDGFSTRPRNGIAFAGSNSRWIVVGNDFTGNSIAIDGSPTGDDSVLRDNLPNRSTP